MYESLKLTSSTMPRIVMVTPDISEHSVSILKKMGLQVIHVEELEPGQGMMFSHEKWKKAFTKIRIWSMVQFTRLIWIDSDFLILKNLDDLFNATKYPLSEDFHIYVLPDLIDCEQESPFLNSGLMVIEPNISIFEAFITKANKLSPQGKPIYPNDQFLIYQYFFDKLTFLDEIFGTAIWRCACNNINFQKNRVRAIHFTTFWIEFDKLASAGYFSSQVWKEECAKEYYDEWIEIFRLVESKWISDQT
eukprot:TRINITY_DN4912_c0_g6_i1.p1 TRINITY_DN4912_c0_g6~~TRINITY_DN4912_c0_g6_i1.p1  ORF type:complete len:248 (-),score=30.22 TRINITY_DN4912_c0_g6_i1:194-937(-)